MGFSATISQSNVESIFNKIMEEFQKENLLPDLLNNEDFKEHIKANIVEAINSQRLPLTALKNDPEFVKQFTLALMTNYLMEKYDGPAPDLKIFFMKKVDDEVAYKHALKEMLTTILTERNKLEPEDKKLNEDQINQLVDALMQSKDPAKMLEALVNDLTKEQLQKNQADETHEKDAKLTPEEKEQKREEREIRLIGGIIPVQNLGLSHIKGTVTQEAAAIPGLLNPETIEKLIKHVGFAVNIEAYDHKLSKHS